MNLIQIINSNNQYSKVIKKVNKAWEMEEEQEELEVVRILVGVKEILELILQEIQLGIKNH